MTSQKHPSTVSRGPRNSPGFLLWHATLRWQRKLKAALAPLELTHVQFVLLASLWWLTDVEKKTPSQRELADHAGTDIMMTSQVLRSLEKRELIRRTVDEQDTRTKRLTITKAGVKLAQQAVKVVEREDSTFFQPATAATDLKEMLIILSDVEQLLKEG